MKKQINPTIKAHLIRGAFYLLLLIAVCAIPFALAQSRSRGATKRGVTNPASRALSSGSGLLPNDVRTSPGRDAKLGEIPSSGLFPSDVRTSPGRHAKLGEIPTRLTATTGPKFRNLPQPKLPNVILYDQYDNAGTNATSSQDFEAAFDPFDDFAADDFVVPAGQTWNVSEVDIQGTYDGFTGPALSFHVFFYQDSGGLPGTQVYAAMDQPYTTSNNIDFVVNLTTPAVLSAGTYWVSVQCRMDFNVGGQWYWQDRTVQSNSPAAWENPGGGFLSACNSWGQRANTCGIDPGVPDQVYRIAGTIGGGTPTPTATASPTATATATGSPGPTCTPSSFTGSITTNSPIQTGRLFRSGIPQTCPASTTCSIFDTLPHHYDAHTYFNNSATTLCATIDTNTACTGTNFVFTAAYLDTFDPNNICNNWIGDGGSSPNPDQPFDVEVPAGHSVVIVTSEVTPDAGCSSYTVTVSGGLCPSGGGTPTPTPTGSPTCTPIVIVGSIDTGDPTQTDKLVASGNPQTCAGTETCAIFGDPSQFHYDAYTFTNTSGTTQCVTIDATTSCIGNHNIFVAAYSPSFDPTNVCNNWIGDIGSFPNPEQSFSVTIANGQTFVVVVSEYHHAGCPMYTLTITGLCGGGTPTPTPTATATSSPGPTCTPSSFTGSIDTNSPIQTGRLFRSGIPQTCPASTTCSIFDTLPHHYDAHTYVNNSGTTLCATIDTNTNCTGTNFIFTAAYLDTFDPNNICTNWIGDDGSSPNPDQAFDVNVPAGHSVVIVTSEVTPDAGCPSYTVTVSGGLCPSGGTPTPTPTATFTATATATATTTGTGTPTPTATATSTATATATGTAIASATPTSTARPTPTPRAKPTPRPAPTPAPRPTVKPSATPTPPPPTATATFTPTPPPNASATPTPPSNATPTPTVAPVEVFVYAWPHQVAPGGDASFFISTVHGPVAAPLTVFYRMAGTAIINVDYTLSGIFGQATIAAGETEAEVVLHALGGAGRHATMILTPGPGYEISDVAGQDTINIQNP